MTITLYDRGRRRSAHLPVRWEAGRSRQARRLLDQAQATMRALRSVRETERVTSVPGRGATTRYVLQAPDRMTFQTDLGVRSVIIGSRQWIRTGASGYRQTPYGAGLAFSTRTWFTWSTYAQFTYLLGMQRERGRDVAVVALMDPGTPAWYRLHIDRRSHRVLRARLITYAHFSTERFAQANVPVRIQPPIGSDHGPRP